VQTPPAQPQPPRAEQDSGGFNIVFGALSSERAAKAQAKEIKAQLSDILVNRELNTVADGMLYKIVAGPYRARSAADALCRTIKERGVDCQVTR
jgi:cell division septation protein DedD